MDGKWASALESIRFCLPRPWEEQSTVITDLFALGSTIYEIMTSGKPYENLPDDEVESRYRQGIFPNVKTICCGEVIESCWRAELVSAAEVMRSIRTVTDMLRRESIDLEYISA
jgi:serine/threonine protein kinase